MNADEKEVIYGFLCETNNMQALLKLLNTITEDYKRKILTCTPSDERQLMVCRNRYDGAVQLVGDLMRNVNSNKGENK